MSGALGNFQVQGRNAAFSNVENMKYTKLSFRKSQVIKVFRILQASGTLYCRDLIPHETLTESVYLNRNE